MLTWGPPGGDSRRSLPRPEEWLLVEWPEDEPQPAKFWLSNLPAGTPIERLVHLAKLRWLIERDYLELKQELGFGHYEGRGWRGFHHTAMKCMRSSERWLPTQLGDAALPAHNPSRTIRIFSSAEYFLRVLKPTPTSRPRGETWGSNRARPATLNPLI